MNNTVAQNDTARPDPNGGANASQSPAEERASRRVVVKPEYEGIVATMRVARDVLRGHALDLETFQVNGFASKDETSNELSALQLKLQDLALVLAEAADRFEEDCVMTEVCS